VCRVSFSVKVERVWGSRVYFYRRVRGIHPRESAVVGLTYARVDSDDEKEEGEDRE
jgi:hypothetical protein